MGSVDDRTFKVNFSGEGAEKLRVTVKEKLKEFMGDYTDDSLVEYVVVLLRNGRRKEEARNELDVFLGDDSDSFISWLWDHLATNLELYVKPHEPDDHVPMKLKPLLLDQAANVESLPLDIQKESRKSSNQSRSRHNREWKGLVRDAGEPPSLQSTEFGNIPVEEETHVRVRRVERSDSPQYYLEKKRKRPDEQKHVKREPTSKLLDAPRRLLQFAVRDAVAMSRTSDSAVGQAPKRLRSVLSATSSDVDHPQKVQSVARVPNPMSTVIKAVAEAAQDVQRVRPSGNVFDRLSRSVDASEPHIAHRKNPTSTDTDGYGDFNQIPQKTYLSRHDYGQRYVEDDVGLENEADPMYDDISDSEGRDDPNIVAHSNCSQLDVFGRSGEHLMTMLGSNSMPENADNDMKSVRYKSQELPYAESAMDNVPMKSEVLKASHNEMQKQVDKLNNQKHFHRNSTVASKLAKKVESTKYDVANGNGKFSADTSQETQRSLPPTAGSLSAVRSSEDSDSRTIFVSNVHTAATKDSLSQHFSKFGELVKVVINTDAATGQPIGSAVVEFTHKEAADNALSLNGTTFLSRVLKVVKRSSSLQQAPSMAWPRLVRAAPYARFPRVPFIRGTPATFRSRLPLRLGARSMQWKRDSQGTATDSSGSVSTPTMSTVRKFTYVRTEPKPGSSVGST